jgi:hypothetical protein
MKYKRIGGVIFDKPSAVYFYIRAYLPTVSQRIWSDLSLSSPA